MAYPNPLSDVPKVNGDRIHVRNQSENDIDGTLVLISQPTKGPGRLKRKAGRTLGMLWWAIVIVAVPLLWSVTLKAAQHVGAKWRPAPTERTETFEELMEKRQQEAREAQP